MRVSVADCELCMYMCMCFAERALFFVFAGVINGVPARMLFVLDLWGASWESLQIVRIGDCSDVGL